MAINNTCQKPSLVPKGPLALMPKCNDDHFCFFSHLVERTKVMSVLKAQGHLSAQGSSGLWWVVMLTFDDTNLVKKKGFVAFEMSNLKRNCIETWKVDQFFFFSNRRVNFYREVYGSSFLRFLPDMMRRERCDPVSSGLYPISLLLPPTTTRVLELIDMHAYYSGHAGETPTVYHAIFSILHYLSVSNSIFPKPQKTVCQYIGLSAMHGLNFKATKRAYRRRPRK